HGCPRDPPSSPTRRSSDLLLEAAQLRWRQLGRIQRGQAFPRLQHQFHQLPVTNPALLIMLGQTPAGPPLAQPLALDEAGVGLVRSEEHTSELPSRENLVCR